MKEAVIVEKWSKTFQVGYEGHDIFVFEDGWELVPRKWTAQIFYKGRKLAEKTFTVYKPQEDRINIQKFTPVPE